MGWWVSKKTSHLDSEDKSDPLVILTDDHLVLGVVRLCMDDTSHVLLDIIRIRTQLYNYSY